ncbi:MAG: TIM barrel protein [Planctomycetes bacterium]|nr:TIM barrel protein [Planctomycetota bacterium]
MIGRVGVCSWSLKPENPADLVAKVQSLGLTQVQIALAPLRDGRWKTSELRNATDRAKLSFVSGMIAMQGEDYATLESIKATGGVRVDKHWKQNLENARAEAAIARELGLSLVTFHAGFLPESRSDPERTKMIERLRMLADVFGEAGIKLGFETGQETADTLLEVLARVDKTSVGVNFDPANMILYGKGEPVAALRRLARHVLQVHVKDARASVKKGRWGTEVAVGTGEVDWKNFLGAVRSLPQSVDLVIEREAGEDRSADIRKARELVERS